MIAIRLTEPILRYKFAIYCHYLHVFQFSSVTYVQRRAEAIKDNETRQQRFIEGLRIKLCYRVHVLRRKKPVAFIKNF